MLVLHVHWVWCTRVVVLGADEAGCCCPSCPSNRYAPIYTRLCAPVSRNIDNWSFVRTDLGAGGNVTVRYKVAVEQSEASKQEESKGDGETKMVTVVFEDMDAAINHLSRKFFLLPLISASCSLPGLLLLPRC